MLKALIAVSAALLLAAGSAHADTRIVRPPVGSIQFAGDSLVWDETIGSIGSADVVEYVTRIVRRVPGRAPRVIATPASSIESTSEGGDDHLRWDASSGGLVTAVGFTNFEAASQDGGVRLAALPFGGRAIKFSSCDIDGGSEPPPLAASGTAVAYVDLCDEDDPVVVGQLDRPHAAPLFSHESADSEVDIAGNYLAMGNYDGRTRTVEVYDWRDGSLLYAVRAKLDEDEERAGTFEVQADGKLAAILRGSGDFCDAAWFSPAEPRPHVVGTTLCYGDVRLASDRLAWMRIAKQHGELVVTPLGSPGRAAVRFPARQGSTSVPPFFAWDGRRLAYSVERCDGRSDLRVRTHTDAPAFRDRKPRGCPLHLPSHTVYVKRHARSARIPLRCPRGCAGTIAVVKRYAGLYQPFALRPGRGKARLFLDEGIRSGLAHDGTARIRVQIDAGGRLRGIRRRIVLRLYARR